MLFRSGRLIAIEAEFGDSEYQYPQGTLTYLSQDVCGLGYEVPIQAGVLENLNSDAAAQVVDFESGNPDVTFQIVNASQQPQTELVKFFVLCAEVSETIAVAPQFTPVNRAFQLRLFGGGWYPSDQITVWIDGGTAFTVTLNSSTASGDNWQNALDQLSAAISSHYGSIL